MSDSRDDPDGRGGDRATVEGSFTVPDMDCPGCAGKVEASLGGLTGIDAVDTRPASGTVHVTFDDSAVSVADLTEAIEAAGYEVTERPGDAAGDAAPGRDRIWTSGDAIKIWVGAAFLACGLLLNFVFPNANAAAASVLGTKFVLADVFFLGAVAAAGQKILRGGYYSARNLNLDIDFLMSAAIVSAITASVLAPAESLYVEAATLAVLFSFAELLEGYAMDRARNSLRELMDLSPDEATVRRDGDAVTVPVDAVVVGDVVLVKPGEKIPMDGEIVDGASALDESPITGESVPVTKAVGDEVYAGTINEEGYLEVQVTSESSDNTLAKLIELVEDAQSNKTEREQFVERFASYYTPIMVSLALLVAAGPPLAWGLSWSTWFVNGITMLVLACPCAFVISTPVSVVSGITSAARNGVLIKGGDHLEAMGAVDVVAMDKTGTLTKGELTVTDVIPLNDHDAEEVLRCARGVEQRSQHPIGEAIVDHADETADAGEEAREIAEFESMTGKGVQAALDGTRHYAGNPALFDELGFDLEHVHVLGEEAEIVGTVRDLCSNQGCLNLVEDTIPDLRDEGKTVVLVGTEDEIEGIIAVAEEVRPEAEATVQQLHELGIETVMLTGDNEGTARAIAEQVGIEHFRAGLLPEEKIDEIEALEEAYDGVAMVGDGINDAPALASATVGIAMGAAGTDTALETADVALMEDDLTKLPYLAALSADANAVIRQNVWASLAIKLVLAVGVPLGFVNVAAAVLIGDAGMTVGVTGNAMRLSNVKPK